MLNNGDFARTIKQYAQKYHSLPYGGSFRKWVWSLDGEPYGSLGNESVMRVAPVGFRLRNSGWCPALHQTICWGDPQPTSKASKERKPPHMPSLWQRMTRPKKRYRIRFQTASATIWLRCCRFWHPLVYLECRFTAAHPKSGIIFWSLLTSLFYSILYKFLYENLTDNKSNNGCKGDDDTQDIENIKIVYQIDLRRVMVSINDKI